MEKGYYKDDFFDGQYIMCYENGKLQEIYNYTAGKLNGEYKLFYENGNFEEIGNYVDNKLEGEYFHYDNVGKLVKKEIYKNGNLLNTEEFEKVEGDKNEGNKS